MVKMQCHLGQIPVTFDIYIYIYTFGKTSFGLGEVQDGQDEMPPGADSISNHYRILGMGDRACLATWYALRSLRGECSWSQGGRRSPRGPLSGKLDRGSEIPCRE